MSFADAQAALSSGASYAVDVDLVIPSGANLKGPTSFVGSPGPGNWASLPGLDIAPSASVRLSNGAGLDGVLLRRKGMTFPATDTSAFSGSAVIMQGIDAYVLNSAILGFSQAIRNDGYERPRIDRVNIDCLNGVWISGCYDVAYLREVHCWPFSMALGGDSTKFHRSGEAFKFTDNVDWARVTDCFSYGYFRGIHIKNANDIMITGHGIDGTTLLANSIGLFVEGSSLRTRFNGNVSSQDFNVYMNSPDILTLMGSNFTTARVKNVSALSFGEILINGCTIGQSPEGIYVDNSVSRVKMIGSEFIGNTVNIHTLGPAANIVVLP